MARRPREGIKLQHASDSPPRGFLKTAEPTPEQEEGSRTEEFAFLVSFQVTLMQLAWDHTVRTCCRVNKVYFQLQDLDPHEHMGTPVTEEEKQPCSSIQVSRQTVGHGRHVLSGRASHR
jgi:hypothetical protein